MYICREEEECRREGAASRRFKVFCIFLPRPNNLLGVISIIIKLNKTRKTIESQTKSGKKKICMRGDFLSKEPFPLV